MSTLLEELMNSNDSIHACANVEELIEVISSTVHHSSNHKSILEMAKYGGIDYMTNSEKSLVSLGYDTF